MVDYKKIDRSKHNRFFKLAQLIDLNNRCYYINGIYFTYLVYYPSKNLLSLRLRINKRILQFGHNNNSNIFSTKTNTEYIKVTSNDLTYLKYC